MATTTDRKLNSDAKVPSQRGAKGGAADDDAPAPKSKKKLVIIAVAVLLLLLGGAAAYFLVLAPGGEDAEAAAEEEVEHVPGTVVPMDPITINLADGAYLQLGIALQAEEGADAHGDIDGSHALHYAIKVFSGRTLAELSAPEVREELRQELVTEVAHAYHDHVYDVYFTEFVMQ